MQQYTEDRLPPSRYGADFADFPTTMENTAEKDARVAQPRAASESSSAVRPVESKEGENGITILNEATNLKDTAYAFSTRKKWWILTVVALCQTSMSKSSNNIQHERSLTTRLQTSTPQSTPTPSPRSTSTTTWAPTISPTRVRGWPGS
jgi:hypothetical protein